MRRAGAGPFLLKLGTENPFQLRHRGAHRSCYMGETVNRIIFGVIIGGLVICALVFDFWHRAAAFVMISSIAFLGVNEFYRLTDRGYEGRALRLVGYFFALLILLGFYAQYLVWAGQVQSPIEGGLPRGIIAVFHPGSTVTPFVFLLFVVVALTVQLILRPLDGTIYSVSVTIFGVVYACLPMAFVFLYFTLDAAIFYIVYFVLASEMTDAGAYFSGRWFGRHNAGLQASPKKTYEGYIGGVIFANVVTLGFILGWNHWAARPAPIVLLESAIVTFVVSFITIFGDLAESALKRDAKIKDSASIIPGHGGILDLVDALLFVLPIGYYYLHFKRALGFIV